MGKTAIEWATYTFNPWWGCVNVSPACDHCYAESLANRFGFKIWGKDAPRRFFGDKHWEEPVRWDHIAKERMNNPHNPKPRVFCGSMCDVMEDRDDLRQSRARLYHLIEDTPNLIWMLLTKRPQNFNRFLPQQWLDNPLRNVWLMTTVESPEYLWRVDALIRTPATVRGLSVEPLLAPLELDDYLKVRKHWKSTDSLPQAPWHPPYPLHWYEPQALVAASWRCPIDWVIVGGESGRTPRATHSDWVRSLRDQCKAAKVAFFFKQWGEYEPFCTTPATEPTGEPTNFFVFQDGLAMRRVGKKAAGRLLDGKEYNEVPQ
jgi:protein gp37